MPTTKSTPEHWLLLAHRLSPGGMALFLGEVADGLVRAGDQCTILTPDARPLEPTGVTEGRSDIAVLEPASLSYRVIRHCIGRKGITIIKLFTGAFPPDTRLAIRLIGQSVPIVESLHSLPPGAKVRLLQRLFYRARPRKQYRCVVFNQDVYRALIEQAPSLRDCIRHLPFGMRLPQHDSPLTQSRWTRRIVTACRLDESVKDVATLLKALALLRSRSAYRVELDIFGDGPDRAWLERLASQLDLDRAVRFLGWDSRWYRNASHYAIFVLSTKTESFGRANIEAAACQLPVIATDTAGCRLSVAKGENGTLVPLGNPAVLATEISRLLQDESLRLAYATAGLQHAARFDITHFVGRLQELALQLRR